jgi:hypothetical protein
VSSVHALPSLQVNIPDGVQVPAWHVSPVVHALASLQAVPTVTLVW